jgi:hypothetical protein
VKRYSPSLVYPFKGRKYVLNDALHDSNTVDIDRCPACKTFADEPRLDDKGRHIGNWLGADPLDYGTRYAHSHKYSFRHGNDIYVQGHKVIVEEVEGHGKGIVGVQE